MSALPVNVARAARVAALWVRDLTDDWIFVKQEILTELDNDARALFSRRDERTKQILELNAMEQELVILWKELTGVELKLRSFKERREIRWWKPIVEFEDD